VDETLEVIEAVGSEHVKLVFDTYHLGQDHKIVDRIPEIARHVAIVHLGDARQPPDGEQNRCRLGDGTVPLKEIVDALVRGGYDGYFDVELLGEEIETLDYHGLLEHAKQAYGVLVGGGQ
jgi:sugar phosphate isomerase/epimerase